MEREIMFAVNAKNLEELESLINNYMYISHIEKLEKKFTIYLYFSDDRELFNWVDEHLKNIGEELAPFFQEIDMVTYGISLNMSICFDYEDNIELFYEVGDDLAKNISTHLETGCVYFYETLDTPIALYDKGKLVKMWNMRWY